MDRLHLCRGMPAKGVYVCLAEHFVNDARFWRWCLYFERTATEDDLETHHTLEREGEALWCAAIGISHCPFCGELLPGSMPTAGRAAEMSMTDYRFDWRGR